MTVLEVMVVVLAAVLLLPLLCLAMWATWGAVGDAREQFRRDCEMRAWRKRWQGGGK